MPTTEGETFFTISGIVSASDGEELLVLCNLTAHEVPVTLPEGWAGAEKLLGNYTETAAALRPYECTVLKK